jgi:hypothetical protein
MPKQPAERLKLRRLRPRATAARDDRIVDVGWLLADDKSGFLYDAPRRIQRNDQPPAHAKSAAFCPSVLDHEARLFEVPCPFDLELGLRADEKGVLQLVNALGDHSPIRAKHLGQLSALVSRREWRHPDRPLVQIITPYVFLADEPVFMTQMPPFHHYRAQQLPGTLVGGRLPIHIWPRQMMWALEWYDTKQTIKLKRGEPWFTVRFETMDPSRPVRLIEAERTPELAEYMAGLTGVANYVRRTYSLFATAKDRRPAKLLVKKQR